MKFTWSNRHNDETYTMEQLDMFAANKQWLADFNNHGLEFLVTSRFDHHPLLLITK